MYLAQREKRRIHYSRNADATRGCIKSGTAATPALRASASVINRSRWGWTVLPEDDRLLFVLWIFFPRPIFAETMKLASLESWNPFCEVAKLEIDSFILPWNLRYRYRHSSSINHFKLPLKFLEDKSCYKLFNISKYFDNYWTFLKNLIIVSIILLALWKSSIRSSFCSNNDLLVFCNCVSLNNNTFVARETRR